MLHEFAMTPDLFGPTVAESDKPEGTILTHLLRGIARNGLLANPHKDRWLRHVIDDRMPALKPGLRDKLLNCFNILENRHRLVRYPKRADTIPTSDVEWLKLTIELHADSPFHAIFLSQELRDSSGENTDCLVVFSESLDSSRWLECDRTTLEVKKTPSELEMKLSPVLRHAKTLSLIDPYMNSSEKRYFDTVDICSRVMGKRSWARLPGRIHIHAELKRQKPDSRTAHDYVASWESNLKQLCARDGHRFHVFLWESLPGSETLHDRYILTDQCGISVPGGLDCRTGSHPNSTIWSLLDDDVRVRLLQDYSPGAGPFELAAKGDAS